MRVWLGALLVGVAFVIIAATLFYRAVSWESSAARAEATVVAIKTHPRRNGARYELFAQFVDHAGEQREADVNVDGDSLAVDPSVGMVIPVLYDRANPTDVRYPGERPWVILPLFVIGFAQVLVGGIGLIRGRSAGD